MNPYDGQAGGPEERGGPDQADGPEEPVAGRVFVPEGPRWDAWIAPDGGAVTLSIQAKRLEVRRLRLAKPRPFGFAPSSAHPVPAWIGETHGAGTLSSGLASVLGFRTSIHTMSIHYGDPADRQAPTAEIISDLHLDYQDRDLTEELLAYAASKDKPPPEVTSATIEIVVSGKRRPIRQLRLGEFSAFQAGEEDVLVTVLARHMESPFPAMERMRTADLEPMIAAMEIYDRDLIATAFAEERRRHVEQLRDQSP